MRILTLNMKMFNLQIDNSFYSFLEEYKPDIAIIQECRYTKISRITNYSIVKPNQYEEDEKIDGRHVITMALCKEDIWNRVKVQKLKSYGRCYVEIKTQKRNENNDWSILGVHIPTDINENRRELSNLISAIKNSHCDIICGDFNASSKIKNL